MDMKNYSAQSFTKTNCLFLLNLFPHLKILTFHFQISPDWRMLRGSTAAEPIQVFNMVGKEMEKVALLEGTLRAFLFKL